jgi:hypothetical protein
MNTTTIETQVAAIKEATKMASKTKETALKFLVNAGIVKPNIIFLDIDGVLNCDIFYRESYKSAKKKLKKAVKKNEIDSLEYYKSQICSNRVALLNQLCIDTNAVIVVSSSWRNNKTVEELQTILNNSGATFTVIDKTPYTGYERGTEISKWLNENIKPETYGCQSYDFYQYAIIDDDSDMLLNQQQHFFQTDSYSGLTYNTCYRIKRFFLHKTF